MARAFTALAAVSTAITPKDLAKRCASLCMRLAARGLPGTPSAPLVRITRTAVFAGAAATAAVGGFALAGFDPSIATAPLVQEGDDDGNDGEVAGDPWIASAPYIREPPLLIDEDLLLRAHGYAAGGTDHPATRDQSEVFVYQGGRLAEDEVKALARQAGWPEHTLEELVEVAWCESRYDPMATNGIIRGLMQVHHLWFEYSGTDFSLWADPLVNLRVALVAYNYDIERGYVPWNQWECRPGGRTGTPNAGLFEIPTPVVQAAGGEPSEVEPTAAPQTPTPIPEPDETPPAATPEETPPAGGDASPTPETATPPAEPEPTATEEPAPTETVEEPPTPPVPPALPDE